MPAIDYVSTVAAVYKDRRAMVTATAGCAIGAGASAYKTGSLAFTAIALLFIGIAVFRWINMTMFQRAAIAPDDVDTAQRWELRAMMGAAAMAAACGIWCFCSFVFVNDAFAELISMTTTVACMVGIVARNFGLTRLLNIQLAAAIPPLVLGLLLKFDIYHTVLALLLMPMLISFKFLAGDIRKVLLASVHSRVEASRLASELDTALETMQHGLCLLDENGLIAVANDRAELTFAGFVAGNWTGRPFAALIMGAATRGAIPQRAAEQLLDMVSQRGYGKVILQLANEEYTEVTVSSERDRTVLLFEDITERRRADEKMNFMAHYDSLTGLPNRAFFTSQVAKDLRRRRQSDRRDLAMLMLIDIDDFKHVNDTLGHIVGDRLLVEVSSRLRAALGPAVLLARLGGDEFIAYRAGAATAEVIAQDTRAVLGAFGVSFDIGGEHLLSNASVGVVALSGEDDDLDALMIKADLALYQSKANGKGQVQLFRPEMDTEYRYRQKLKVELRQTVADGMLTLVYQPLVDLKTRRVVACEALARWNHPEMGHIPPSLFIPIAEEMGLISEITRWVLTSAARECMSWPDEVSVSVNVSARDFRDGDLIETVSRALAGSGLEPHRLELEVTETALIENRDKASKILAELARKGIGIALDDFGTGYSSLSYLQAMPFSKLKVDRSFVIDIVDNPRGLKLLTNVAQLGKDINLTVTAEGVETEDQLNLILAHTKVDQIQGYLFGIPLPRREVSELIARMAGRSPAPVKSAGLVNRA